MNIAAYIDHTALKPITTEKRIRKLCEEARAEHFAAVCVPPYYVALAKELLPSINIKVATVIGFPFGYNTIETKVEEIIGALEAGADELDVVHNLAALRSGDWDYLEKEVAACVEPIHYAGKKIKVIIESGILTDEEIVKCCEIYSKHKIDFMKTSTGYAESGASVHAVALMRKHLPDSIKIKASGGISNFTFAKELIDAGAARLGCSASMQIVTDSKEHA